MRLHAHPHAHGNPLANGGRNRKARRAHPRACLRGDDAKATTWVSGTGSRWVQVIAAIENAGGASLCLSGGAYDLEDALGETGYLYETTLLDEPVDGELTLLARPDVENAKADLVRFAATGIDLAMDPYGDLRIKGRVQNTSDEIYIQTKIVALLFDADGNLLGLD